MNFRKIFRGILFVSILLFLLLIAWWTIEGSVSQWSRSETFGQQLETVVQMVCGILSILVIFTSLWVQKWAYSIRLAWAISLVVVAGLSPIVWGPPMPVISFLFAGTALILARVVTWALINVSWSSSNHDISVDP